MLTHVNHWLFTLSKCVIPGSGKTFLKLFKKKKANALLLGRLGLGAGPFEDIANRLSLMNLSALGIS